MSFFQKDRWSIRKIFLSQSSEAAQSSKEVERFSGFISVISLLLRCFASKQVFVFSFNPFRKRGRGGGILRRVISGAFTT